MRSVIASAAKQSRAKDSNVELTALDCRVAPLLAMTNGKEKPGEPLKRHHPGGFAAFLDVLNAHLDALAGFEDVEA